jgi:hypothetical protein
MLENVRWADHAYRAGRTVMAVVEDTQIQELTREEGAALLDRQARSLLHMTGAEFIAAWDAGAFSENGERPEVVTVAMLLPFGRPD